MPEPIHMPTRRSFHKTMIQVLGAAISALVAAPAAAYLLLKPKSSSGGDLVEVADLSELEVGTPREIVYYRTRVDAWKKTREKATTWVVKTGDSSAVAFNPQCPHLGCTVPWKPDDPTMDQLADKGRFNCPCHGSLYDRYGNIMVLSTHNTDLGDSFEREGDDPEYFRTMSVPGYSFGINVLVYAMTH